MTAPRGARSPGASGGARGAIVIGLAVILGIVGLQILDDSGGGSSSATGTTTVTTVAGTTGTTVAGTTGTTGTTVAGTSTTSAVRKNNEVRVKVYNASGVQGRAQTLTDQLRAEGYNMQTPANLPERRQGTVIECVHGFEKEGGVLALYGVGNGAKLSAYPKSPPTGASGADCLVVIGTA